MKNLAILGSVVITAVITLLAFGSAFVEQETAYEQYKNQVHREYCEIAVARGGSIEHLREEGCK